jgi:hypothetical protein
VLLRPVSGTSPGEPIVQLAPLQVNWCLAGEPTQSSGVVVVEMAERDHDDVAGADAGQLERGLQRIPVA